MITHLFAQIALILFKLEHFFFGGIFFFLELGFEGLDLVDLSLDGWRKIAINATSEWFIKGETTILC